MNEVALDPLPAVDGEVIFDLVGLSREAFLRDFVGASPIPNGEPWKQVTVNDVFLESANGALSRETEVENGRSKNGAVRRKPDRTRDATQNETNGVGIPDYVMRDFGLSDGSRNGRRSRAKDVSDPASDDPEADLSRERD